MGLCRYGSFWLRGAALGGALLVLLISSPTLADTLFVDDDDAGCGGRAPCFATVQGAIDAALDGDEVVVAPGLYAENVRIEEKALALTAESGPNDTVIDGGGVASAIVVFSEADATIDGFTLRNGGGDTSFNEDGHGIFVGGSIAGRVSILNNVLTGNATSMSGVPTGGGGIRIEPEGDDFRLEVEIAGNVITDNRHGILLDAPSHANVTGFVRIVNNVVAYNGAGTAGGGMHLLGCCFHEEAGGFTVDVVHNTVYRNAAAYGGGIAANVSNLTLANNIMFSNEADEVGDDVYLVQASLVADVSSNIIGDGQYDGVAGNVALDPMLVDPDGGSFLPAPGSPAIDAIPYAVNGCGTDVRTDQRGVSRPKNAACEVGALEVGFDVAIDIRPGRRPNTIKPGSHQLIPVAILGSGSFDVTDVDVTTLGFGPRAAAPVRWVDGRFEDVNADDFIDLVSHYRSLDSGIASADEEACVSGEAIDGTPFDGCDSVRTVSDRCGLGFELVLLLPPLLWSRRRSTFHPRRDRSGDQPPESSVSASAPGGVASRRSSR